MRKKTVGLGCLLIAATILFCGCKRGPSKAEVEASEYYQKLQKANKEQKKQIEALEKEINAMSQALMKEQAQDEDRNSGQKGNKKAQQYFDKIKNSSLLRIEVEYTDKYCDSVFVSDKAIFPLARAIAKEADLTTRYTPKALREAKGAGYLYTLYEEDGSIFQAEVYGDGYVIFPDLPGQVYYSPGSASLGRAYLVRRGDYPNSRLLHRMADSAVAIKSGKKAWTGETCIKAANAIDNMQKKKIKKKDREKKPVAAYSFYSYGSQMILTLFDSQIKITAWDGKETWYQITKEQRKELGRIFA